MSKAEFDSYVDDYNAQHAASIRLSGEDPDYFALYKAKQVARALARDEIVPRKIMDFGAGQGNTVPHFQRAFPKAALTCLDVSGDALAHCAGKALREIELVLYDGQSLPFKDATFDLIFAGCVFHHISAAEHVSLLREIRRTMKPHGRFVLFEHNPWNPLTRYAVSRCPFDRNAVLINAPEMRRRLLAAGFEEARVMFEVFFPAWLSALRPIEQALGWFPLGAQYSIVAN